MPRLQLTLRRPNLSLSKNYLSKTKRPQKKHIPTEEHWLASKLFLTVAKGPLRRSSEEKRLSMRLKRKRKLRKTKYSRKKK